MALDKHEIKNRLQELPGWKLDDDEIEKKFKFGDFNESLAFVNEVAALANEADHHPDISIKYAKVKLSLSTHSEGGVTEKDFALAAQIDALRPVEAEEAEEPEDEEDEEVGDDGAASGSGDLDTTEGETEAATAG